MTIKKLNNYICYISLYIFTHFVSLKTDKSKLCLPFKNQKRSISLLLIFRGGGMMAFTTRRAPITSPLTPFATTAYTRNCSKCSKCSKCETLQCPSIGRPNTPPLQGICSSLYVPYEIRQKFIYIINNVFIYYVIYDNNII